MYFLPPLDSQNFRTHLQKYLFYNFENPENVTSWNYLFQDTGTELLKIHKTGTMPWKLDERDPYMQTRFSGDRAALLVAQTKRFLMYFFAGDSNQFSARFLSLNDRK